MPPEGAPGEYQCQHPGCNTTSYSLEQSSQHDLTHHAKRKGDFKCCFPGCTIEIKSKGSLKSHYETVHNGIRYCCPYCDNTYISVSNVLRHIGRNHEGKKQIKGEDVRATRPQTGLFASSGAGSDITEEAGSGATTDAPAGPATGAIIYAQARDAPSDLDDLLEICSSGSPDDDDVTLSTPHDMIRKHVTTTNTELQVASAIESSFFDEAFQTGTDPDGDSFLPLALERPHTQQQTAPSDPPSYEDLVLPRTRPDVAMVDQDGLVVGPNELSVPGPTMANGQAFFQPDFILFGNGDLTDGFYHEAAYRPWTQLANAAAGPILNEVDHNNVDEYMRFAQGSAATPLTDNDHA